jgi:hypothetical protein
MTAKKATPPRGRAVNCYFHEEDTRLIREMATFISSKGHRVSDSQVLKAALRVAKPDGKLLKAFEEVLLMDGRFKREP